MEIRAASSPLMKLQRTKKPLMPLKTETPLYSLKTSSASDIENIEQMRLQKVARGFEGIFLKQLLKVMRSTVPGEGMFGKGVAGAIYADMMDNALSDILAERSVLGLADMISYQLGGTRIPPEEGQSPSAENKAQE